MKKLLRIFAILALLGSSILITPIASAWSPSANIAVSVFGGTDREEPRSMKIDQNGNIYSTGYFSGTADFDPGEGVANLTSLGRIDIFVSKLDPSGNYLWAKRFGGELGDCGNSIGFDSSGNVYSTGGFRGSVDFDPGAGTANLGSGSDYGIYVLKLDPSGNYLWAKSVGSALSNDSRGITVDSNGNSIISGMYTGTVDFNPGGGSADLTSNGSNDIFLLKLDSFGNFSWAKSIGSSTSDESYAITGDNSGNIYTTGPFSGVVDFDPGDGVANLTSAGSADIFVSKLDASGNYVWAKRMGGTSWESGDAIEVDSSGNVYTTGEFSGTADFDPGTGTANLTSVGQRDAFFSKLDASGNYVWAKNIGESLPAWGQSITVDRNGDVYATGGFQGTVDFDSGAGTANLTSNGDYDVYILKLDSSGNYVWVKRFGGLGNDTGFFLTNDYSGNIYTTGFFNGTVDFEPGSRTSEFTSKGDADIFISKLDSSGNAPLVAVVSAGSTPNSKVATIPSGVTVATIAKTDELPAIKLNFGGGVPASVTAVPLATNPASQSATPFTISTSTKIVDIQVDSSFSGSATICLDGAPTDRLYHYSNSVWVQLSSQNYVNGQVCGVTTSFSPFAAASPGLPGLISTFSSVSSLDSRMTAQVSNFDTAFTYAVSSTAGSASINSTGLITVTNLGVDQSATITVVTTRAGYESGSSSVTGQSQVAPMVPTNKPILTISDSLIKCSIGTYSATPTSSIFSLFVDGKHISTNFSSVGEYLPDWIIPWATSSTITRTASLTSATWVMSDAYKGKAITCTTLAYSKNAIGLTSSEKMVVK